MLKNQLFGVEVEMTGITREKRKGGRQNMICYDRLWKTLIDNHMNKTELRDHNKSYSVYLLFSYYIVIVLFCQLFILLLQKLFSFFQKKSIDTRCAYGNIFIETE